MPEINEVKSMSSGEVDNKSEVVQLEKNLEQVDLLPEFVKHRISKFEEIDARNKRDYEDKDVTVTLSDGKEVVVKMGSSPLEVAKTISDGFARKVVVAKKDGDELIDLSSALVSDCKLEFLDFDTPEGKHVFWHSSAHILGEALERVFGCFLTIGPALEDGFYYDCEMDGRVIQAKDFKIVEKEMQKIAKERQAYEHLFVTKEEALDIFKFNKYKQELIGERIKDGEMVSLYRCGSLIDLCRGPHLPNTSMVKSVLVTKNSSAYWRGDAQKESLQRLYAVAFPDRNKLKAWKKFQEEAAKRDHRLIGGQQELYFFNELSPGSCFFLPHGTRIYNKLIDFVKKEYWGRGYAEVMSPNVYNVDLWKTSGHWQHYQENMFSFKCEDAIHALKPMNCPGHCVMFKHRTRSWREMPIRMADFGVLHRNELSGALSGLTRVRKFVQDDAHIFCRPDQIKDEVKGVLDFIEKVYEVFNFRIEISLSTRPEKYIGEISVWDKAEQELEEALNEWGRPWKLNPADGAFYGPKIDITVFDALNRQHQCATCQLDFQLPQRFGLSFIGQDGGKTPPVMIHRAILGSIERFIAVLIEHIAGKWPLWLSPRQIMVIPAKPEVEDYALKVQEYMHNMGFFVDTDMTEKRMDKKIREATMAGYNYIFVVGPREKENGAVNIRPRGVNDWKKFTVESLSDAAKRLGDEVEKKQ